MKFSILRFLPLALCPLLLSSCAKSPAGGPVIQAPNRFEVALTTVQTINPSYYYAVAFDDIPNDGRGPIGIDSNTTILNGVVGGQFRVLVLYNQNRFRVFYRSTPSDETTEREVLVSPFVGAPQATTNGLRFTLDLDAKLDTNTYFFTHTVPTPDQMTPRIATDSLDINFVTTNTIIRSSQDNRVKPVDTYGSFAIATPLEFQIGATRRTLNPDDSNDRRLNVDSSFNSVNYGQLDVNQLELNVTRG